MKKVILIIIIFVLVVSTVLYARAPNMGLGLGNSMKIITAVTPGTMDGAIANPAAVKIANPGGQNLSIN